MRGHYTETNSQSRSYLISGVRGRPGEKLHAAHFCTSGKDDAFTDRCARVCAFSGRQWSMTADTKC